MAPNATATKPDLSAVKKASRQPPADSVWVQGTLSHVAAWSLHLLVIGAAILWAFYLAYYFGFSRPQRELPVEPVQFSDGGGNKEGTGNGPGGSEAPPDEGAPGDKNRAGDKSQTVLPDRPSLTNIQAKQLETQYDRESVRYITEGPPSAGIFAGLEDDLRRALSVGINPSPGNGGPGKDGGMGPGNGTARVLNEREKRMLRWSMKFNTRDGGDYLRQLEGLGAIVAIPDGRDQFKVADLTRRPLRFEQKGLADLSDFKRIWWIDNNVQSVGSLARAMGYGAPAPEVIAFIPEELEKDLAQKELAYANGLSEDQIYETTFEVFMSGGKYDVRVTGQKRK